MVQHRAARFVKSVPHRRTKPLTSVSVMVGDLGWEPLQTRRPHGRLNMFFKITRGMVELPPEYHPFPRHQPATRGHSQQFQRLQPSVDAYKYAFFPRTIPAWNVLVTGRLPWQPDGIEFTQCVSDQKSAFSSLQKKNYALDRKMIHTF